LTSWSLKQVPLKFQLSDLTLFSIAMPLRVRSIAINENIPPVDQPQPPAEELETGCEGFLVRGIAVSSPVAKVQRVGRYQRYVFSTYFHSYIDLRTSFDAYKAKFSAKSRATLLRKIRKYSDHCGGALKWRTYRTVDEMTEFYALARAVSSKTYQERLLDAGFPDSESFRQDTLERAAQGLVRAYILFHHDKPVSYLFCPVENGVLLYQYLGYDPEYIAYSVGTILQWLAIEQLFEEALFECFDFTEGQSEHKRFFATHQSLRVNAMFLRSSARNAVVIRAHNAFSSLSSSVGRALDKVGLKAKIRRVIRFGRA
jgi:CelD/BcsL family acetyltransferase involved in cellulose biosynthesis